MRSGSTFTFNVAKHLLARNGATVFCEPADEMEDFFRSKGNDYDHLIFKQHLGSDFSRLLIKHQCAPTICSYRDPLEAMASWMQVFGFAFEQSLHEFKRSIEFINFQRRYALMVSYDEIERTPEIVIGKIARYLTAAIEPAECAAIAASLDKNLIKQQYDQLENQAVGVRDIGFSYYDEDTFFHRQHVRGHEAIDPERFFTKEQRELIRAELAFSIE